MNEYSERIKEVREQAKMSQGDMAFEMEMSVSGYANIERGVRKASVEHLKAVNDAVKNVLGDRLIYLITGKNQAEYLVDHSIDESLIDKSKCLSLLETWLLDMKMKNIIRFKGSVTDLTFLFAKKLKTKHKEVAEGSRAA